jgi:hypothetical protein
MLQFKRFFVLLYIHLTLSVILTYLSTLVTFNFSYIEEDWLKTLFGLGCASVITLLIGVFWGIITPQKKKLLLPLGLYVLVLFIFYGIGVSSVSRWMIYLNANIPYATFIRNVATRTLIINAIHGLGCLIPSLSLFAGFKISYRFSHRQTKLTDQT